MKDKLKKAIKTLAEQIKAGTKPDDALKLTQATLNAAHTLNVLDQHDLNQKARRT